MSFEQAEQTALAMANSLSTVADLVRELGLVEQAQQLQSRADAVRADRFKIVVVGGFSRGKSTLLNAMLGCDILPQKVTPSTAIITLLQYADRPQARVGFTDGAPDEVMDLDVFRRRYVLTEQDFADGQIDADRFSRVDHAVVSYPIELCRHRVELVDSPGLQDDPIRTARTRRFLKRADAVVMVLDATALLTQDELHFLETVLLPEGFKNIFFVVNKWNLVEQSVLRPEDAEREFRDLEVRLRERLAPFCLIDGQDRSAERIVRVNALGALKARLKRPPALASLEESNVPTFERSLQRFLVEDRGQARIDLTRAKVRATAEEVNRYIAAQLGRVGKSIADIEAEQVALEPKLERLRGIRRHILAFLDSQSSNLRDRLVISFQHMIRKLEAELPEETAAFDLGPIKKGSMVWAAATDWARSDENKFAKRVERCIAPQVQRLLERHFAAWHQSVVLNELRTVMIDVDKHLQEEAAEYQRVMQEIEASLGIHSAPLQIDELVRRWLGQESEAAGGAKFELPISGIFAEVFSYMVGVIAVEVVAHVLAHMVLLWLPIVGLVVAAVRLAMKEASLRREINEKIVQAMREGLAEVSLTKAAEIRLNVQAKFDGLKNKIGGNIDEEIAIIAASLQGIIDRKREQEYSAEREKQRLESIRARLTEEVQRLQTATLSAEESVPVVGSASRAEPENVGNLREFLEEALLEYVAAMDGGNAR